MSAKIEATITVNNIDEVKKTLQEAVNTALEAIGMQAESYAKLMCPVDTGRLRNSITHEQENDTTEVIGTNVEYAAYVEMGHHTASGSYVDPQPYLEPAVTNHTSEYQDIVERYLRNS